LNAAAGLTVRVMTWNIHGAVGRNPRFDLGRVVALVRRHRPDIVALQEIDSRRARDSGEDPFEVLQAALGSHGVGARTVTTADGDYGQALISRWPLANTEIHDLSFREREPRRAICSDVQTPAGPLRVIATHLGLSFRERRSQALALLKMLDNLRTTTVALGDFNDWLWAGSVRRHLGRVLPACTRHRTFPARCPLFHLDRVYLWPRDALIGSHTDPAARALSDHLPVVSDFRVAAVARDG
jgi:endonuclease/exonuclease/phosphatase family metal-dependent hydrolase